jgi:glutathione S-transferase
MSELEIIGVPQSNFVRTVRIACEEKLFPDDAMRCAKIEQWVSIANTAMIPAMNAYLQCYFLPRTADGQPDRALIEKTLPELHTYVGVCHRAVSETGHLVGTEFSYADMNLLPVLAYLHQCPESAEALSAAKELRQYLNRHGERASFKATVPPPFSELRQPAAAVRPGNP